MRGFFVPVLNKNHYRSTNNIVEDFEVLQKEPRYNDRSINT